MRDQPADLLQGTLDLLILRVLAQEAAHGWAIAQHIQYLSRDVLQVNQGSLYPALHRLEARGLVRGSWGSSVNNRRARFYHITARGRRQLAREGAQWERFSAAVNAVLANA